MDVVLAFTMQINDFFLIFFSSAVPGSDRKKVAEKTATSQTTMFHSLGPLCHAGLAFPGPAVQNVEDPLKCTVFQKAADCRWTATRNIENRSPHTSPPQIHKGPRDPKKQIVLVPIVFYPFGCLSPPNNNPPKLQDILARAPLPKTLLGLDQKWRWAEGGPWQRCAVG